MYPCCINDTCEKSGSFYHFHTCKYDSFFFFIYTFSNIKEEVYKSVKLFKRRTLQTLTPIIT